MIIALDYLWTHLSLFLSNKFHCYSSQLIPTHNQTVKRQRRCHCDQCVCTEPNTGSLSPRKRESDSWALWQPLLSLWLKHRNWTDLMRFVNANICSPCFLPLSQSFSSTHFYLPFPLPQFHHYLSFMYFNEFFSKEHIYHVGIQSVIMFKPAFTAIKKDIQIWATLLCF